MGEPIRRIENTSEPIRGIIYDYTKKVYQKKKKAWFSFSSSLHFNGVDRATMSKIEDKISLLTTYLAAIVERGKEVCGASESLFFFRKNYSLMS